MIHLLILQNFQRMTKDFITKMNHTPQKTTATPDHYLLPQVCPVSEINPQEQGFIPLYKREAITDVLHEVSGFRTDYQFIL